MTKNLLIIALLLAGSHTFAQTGIDKPRYEILTHRAGNYLGTFDIELFPLIAPLHTANFDSLVNDQFYDSTAFHRVVPGFVIQGGDPNSINGPISTWGQGQPWQVTVPAEFNAVRHLRGIMGAARDVDPNSANSQFYICVASATFLDGNYTVYGQVTSGMDVVDTIVNSPRDANDVPLQKIEMFVTYIGVNDSVPTAPSLVSPANGATGILNTQNFTWTSVPTAVLYTIEFSTDPAFSTIALSINSGTTFALATGLQGSNTYYWRVKSNNGGHESIPSNVYSFSTATGSANLVYPPDTSYGISINPVFVWDPVTNADSYTLQVSTSATFIPANMVYNTAGLLTTSQQVNGLNPNSLYYWRVRSASGAIQGFYSVKFSFTTGSSTGVNEHSVIAHVSAYPNPASSNVTVSGYVRSGGVLRLRLMDLSGKTITRNEKRVSPGSFNLDLDLLSLEAGAYFLEAELGGENQVIKIMKQGL